MPILSNPKHEAFAQAVAKGASATEAYRQIYGSKPAVSEANSSRLLRNAKVAARVAEIQGASAAVIGWDLQKAMQYALDVLNAKPEDADASHPLSELHMSKAGPFYAFPSKEGMFDKLNKLCGLYKPEKHEHDGKLEIIIRKL